MSSDRLSHSRRRFAFSIPGGAHHYRDTGAILPPNGMARAGQADAILFGAMGWPDIRYPDGTEIAPQLDRKRYMYMSF